MIVVAGGSSTRFGADKLLADVEGRPLILHSIEAVAPHVDVCVVACSPNVSEVVERLAPDAVRTSGGRSRTLSEMAGLAALGDGADLIGIHDAARPVVSAALIERLFETAAQVGGAIPVIDPADLIIDRKTHLPHDGTQHAQTPQVFQAAPLLTAYVKAARADFEGHDTAEVVQRFTSATVVGVPGETANVKVTYRADLESVAETIRARSRT